MKSYTHTEYVGGNPGIIGNGSNTSSRSVNVQVNLGCIDAVLSPNPAFEFTTLTIKDFRQSCSVEVVDLQGRIVKQLNMDQEKITIDISDLESGLYLVRVINDFTSQSLKLIKP